MDFLILGPLEVRDGDRPVAVGGMRQRALLGMLLLHANEVVSTDRLIDELWEGDRREDAAKALRVARADARSWLAHTRRDYARMLSARDAPGDAERASELRSRAVEEYRALGIEHWASEAGQPQ